MPAGMGARIKAKRDELGFSQEAVARHLGFKDRQTLSAIETGERKVSAEELVRFSEVLAAPLDYFTDPFLLVGEGAFSWRQSGITGGTLDAYERDAGRLIALHRALGAELGHPPALIRPTLALTRASSFEDAQAAGERFAEKYALGDVPALGLPEVMERELGILVLMPRAALARFGPWADLDEATLADRLNAAAEELGVTSSALRWRLVAIGALPKAVAAAIEPTLLRGNGRHGRAGPLPPLFSRAFVERLAEAIDTGRISARRAVGVLGVDIDDVEAICAAHGVAFELGM